jgi:hypothetical protein
MCKLSFFGEHVSPLKCPEGPKPLVLSNLLRQLSIKNRSTAKYGPPIKENKYNKLSLHGFIYLMTCHVLYVFN